jgi:phosphohistidine phosphatase
MPRQHECLFTAILRRTPKKGFPDKSEFQGQRSCFRLIAARKRFRVMLRLMLLRHGKSSWPSSATQDVARPLSERGEKAARLMGGYMARHSLVPARVLCSPARRTRETWAGIAAQLPADMDVVFDRRLYEATPQTILSIVRAQDDATHTLLVIGHNPGLQETAELLIAAGDVDLRERLREKFPTAALAVIGFTINEWHRLHERSGRLERYITPRSIAAATN